MSQVLGKRKRRRAAEAEEKNNNGDEAGDAVDFQALLRKHFESRFEPLETTATPASEIIAAKPAQSDDEADEGSDWTGLSEDGDPVVEIIVHDNSHQAAKLSGAELRAFMVRYHPARAPFRLQKPRLADLLYACSRLNRPHSQHRDPHQPQNSRPQPKTIRPKP